MRDELLPCDAGTPSALDTKVATAALAQATPSQRVELCVATITGLRAKDWFRVYCEVELIHETTQRKDAALRTNENEDSTAEPVWTTAVSSIATIASLDEVDDYKLVVRVKRPSRMEKISRFRCEKKVFGAATVCVRDHLLPKDATTLPMVARIVGNAGADVCAVHCELACIAPGAANAAP